MVSFLSLLCSCPWGVGRWRLRVLETSPWETRWIVDRVAGQGENREKEEVDLLQGTAASSGHLLPKTGLGREFIFKSDPGLVHSVNTSWNAYRVREALCWESLGSQDRAPLRRELKPQELKRREEAAQHLGGGARGLRPEGTLEARTPRGRLHLRLPDCRFAGSAVFALLETLCPLAKIGVYFAVVYVRQMTAYST